MSSNTFGALSFGADLLDKQELIERYGEDGCEAIARLAEYIRRKAALAMEYGRGLQKLNRSFAANQRDPKFEDIMAGAEKSAQNYVAMAERVEGEIVERLKSTGRNHDRQRKEILAEIKEQRQEWKKALVGFAKVRKVRDAAIKTADEARLYHERVNVDRNATRSQCEKAQEEYTQRARRAILCREDYSQAVKSIRERQAALYRKELPALFDRLQSFEQNRLACCKNELAELARATLTLCSAELDAAQDSCDHLANEWDPQHELALFIQANRSGKPFDIPDRISDENEYLLSSSASTGSLVSSSNNSSSNAAMAHSSSSAAGAAGEYRPLAQSSNQGRSSASMSFASQVDMSTENLQSRIKDLDREVPLIERKIEGLNSLRVVYDRQPALADERTRNDTHRQLAELSDQLQKRRMEREHYRQKLVEAIDGLSIKGDQEGEETEEAKEAAKEARDTTKEADDGHDGKSRTAQRRGGDALFRDLDPVFTRIDTVVSPTSSKAVGGKFRVHALYDFEACPDTLELSMREGDTLAILTDDGEWWEAVNVASGARGYIPFNYVQSTVK